MIDGWISGIVHFVIIYFNHPLGPSTTEAAVRVGGLAWPPISTFKHLFTGPADKGTGRKRVDLCPIFDRVLPRVGNEGFQDIPTKYREHTTFFKLDSPSLLFDLDLQRAHIESRNQAGLLTDTERLKR